MSAAGLESSPVGERLRRMSSMADMLERIRRYQGWPGRTFVYAIGTGLELGAPVKIGYAKDPIRRLQTLQVAHHEQLLLLAVDVTASEGEFHEMFKHLRIRGEWYRIDAELMEWLTGEWGHE